MALRLNQIKHDILVYHTLIDRYLVRNRLDRMLKIFPVKEELTRLKSWALNYIHKQQEHHHGQKNVQDCSLFNWFCC